MRLMTYNIHKGIGGRDRRYVFDRIVGVIEAENPDLVLLQEVDCGVRRSRYHDQPVLLMERLASRAGLFQLNVSLKEGGYGNLLLARWPIPWHQHVDLRMSVKKPRGAQIAKVATPEGELIVVNWHLGLAEIERRWQVKQVLDHAVMSEHKHLPTIVAGDCNDWRNQLHPRCFAPAGFDHVTAPPSRYRSFPAAMSLGSLDKAFTRGPIHVRSAHVVRSALARDASDHLPLVVDFHLDHSLTVAS
jgi:endonuclease/exonuclease/phosphatase family metal-dependent hydrolase